MTIYPRNRSPLFISKRPYGTAGGRAPVVRKTRQVAGVGRSPRPRGGAKSRKGPSA